MLYAILKFIITIGIRIYYKEIRIENRHKLPSDGPLILVANHPNTMVDGWILGLLYKQPLHFMAKATFFNSGFKKWFLSRLKMIPINRASEQKTKGVSNLDSFSACYDLLNQKGILVIFPEGTSYLERVLREIKTGTARIALEFSNQHDGKSGVKIVPVGINYAQAERFRSRILVDVASPISVDEWFEKNGTNKNSSSVLTNEIRLKLESVLVSSTNKFQDELLEKLQSIYKVNNESSSKVKSKMGELKSISSIIDGIAITKPYKLKTIDELADEIREKINQLGIKPDYLKRTNRLKTYMSQIIGSLFLLVLGIPIFLFGFIHNYTQYKLTDVLIPKLTKDVEYYAPLGIILGIFLYPMFYTGFAWSANEFLQIKGWYLLTYIVLMPLSGLFAITFRKNLIHVFYKWKYYFVLRDRKNEIMLLREKYRKLEELLEL